MAVPSYGDNLLEFCESKGTLEIRRLRSQNHFHSLDWQGVDSWLAVKAAESLARAEDRAEESLSSSRKALRFAISATLIAVIAMAVSVKDQILSLIFGVF